MKIKNFFVSAIIVGLMCCGVYAQEQSAVIWTPFPINIASTLEPKDDKGTDVTNIYTFNVNFADAKYANNNIYTIMYFEDGRPLEEFKGQRLPFVLKRNYKGLEAGDHKIRIDIEDGKGNVLATNLTTVHVTHEKGR